MFWKITRMVASLDIWRKFGKYREEADEYTKGRISTWVCFWNRIAKRRRKMGQRDDLHHPKDSKISRSMFVDNACSMKRDRMSRPRQITTGCYAHVTSDQIPPQTFSLFRRALVFHRMSYFLLNNSPGQLLFHRIPPVFLKGFPVGMIPLLSLFQPVLLLTNYFLLLINYW